VFQAGGAEVSTKTILGAAPFGFKGAVLELSFSFATPGAEPVLFPKRSVRSVPFLPWNRRNIFRIYPPHLIPLIPIQPSILTIPCRSLSQLVLRCYAFPRISNQILACLP
jgi:hypothetical protein